ncbi:hypothetical protein MRB53_011641 [Persea americana]|uniref:Uncharacterized protein n=1 Tax=Persea americana TaxID=3435 RepID=A0ACC2LVA3_PERAE|nr:hypothetical protein MRB53_011641 [Persea americana]
MQPALDTQTYHQPTWKELEKEPKPPRHIFFFFCAPRTSQKTSLLGSTEFLLWSLLEVYKGGFIRAESAYQC